MHPLVKGVWTLVNAAYQVAQAQTELDEHIKGLVDAMDEACDLAKIHAPLKGRYKGTDSVVSEILGHVIQGANVISGYCEKRGKCTCSVKLSLVSVLKTRTIFLAFSAVKTFVSNLAQEVDDCTQALSMAQQKLVARATMQSTVNTEHIMEVVERTGKSSIFFDTSVSL